MTTKKFLKTTLYTATTRNKQIPGTEFAGSSTFLNIHSKKNKQKNAITGEVGAKLSYKIGHAISSSQDKTCQIFSGELENVRFLLGIFTNGSANGVEIFKINLDDVKNDTHRIGTNPFSHFLPQLMLVRSRLLEEQGEIANNFVSIDFETEDKIIGVNQKKCFVTLADALRIEMLELDGLEFDILDDEYDLDYLKELIEHVDKNVTAYLINNYSGEENSIQDFFNEYNCTDYLKNKLLSAEIVKPKEIILEIKEKTNPLLLLKKKYWEGIETFTKREIKAMPLLLKNGYEMAKTSFLANREFFTLQEWELVDAIACGDVHSINFTGPAGVGKTTTIRAIAGALGMPFVLVGGSANIEETDLLGTRNVEAKDGVSVTTWTDGPITSAIRYGGFLLFDEVNAAEPGILMKLNTILDGSKSLMLSTAEEVRVHPKFVYSEAMNVGVGYSGTDVMNQSHLDRMDEMFKISSKTVDEEAKIIASCTGYDNMSNIKKMCKIKQAIETFINEYGDAAEQSCSPRRLIAWCKKAKRTGEFINSSLTTVMAHLAIYDESISELTVESIRNSSNEVAASVMELIISSFENVDY